MVKDESEYHSEESERERNISRKIIGDLSPAPKKGFNAMYIIK